MATVVLLVAARRDWRADLRGVAGQLRRRPVLAIPVVAVGLLAAAAVPLVLYRFAQGGDSLRLDLWRSSLAIFAEHPLLGGGPGTWVQLKVEANPPGAPNLILAHAHNLYFQALAELGLAGVAALAVLAAAVVRRLRAGIHHPDLGPQAIAATAGLVGFLGQSLVDNLVNLVSVCLLIMLPVAWVDGFLLEVERGHRTAAAQGATRPGATRPGATPPGSTAGPPAGPSPIRQRLEAAFLVGCLAALIAVAPTLAGIDEAAAARAEGGRAIGTDAARALAAYDRALAIDPDFTLYRIERAAALARLGRVAEARADLAAAAQLDPVGINLISLAHLDLELGDATAAGQHVRRALELAPYDLPVALNAGLMAERLGDRALALEQLATAVTLRPAIAALPLLDDAARTVPKQEVIARARAMSGPENAALILAYAGDASAAEAELLARPNSEYRDIFLAVVRWLGGSTEEAIQRLAATVRRNPFDYVAAGWLAGILRAEDDSRAGTYLRLVRLVQADVGPGIAAAVTARVISSNESQAGVPFYYPGGIYIRSAGGTVLAPGLTLITAP
jgi:tetratricopeptide (TPR) repeat protein